MADGTTVLSYGGGRQTVAICVLVARGVLPKPDRIVMADTGRETPSTWDYLETYVRPLLAGVGLTVEVAPHSLAKVDLFARNGDMLMPVYTQTGKLPGYCSAEWKRDVVERHLRAGGVRPGDMWIGFAANETRRIKGQERHGWRRRYPLVEAMLTTAGCVEVVIRHGLPEPPISACWMCPNKKNLEWAWLKRERPDLFEQACELDDEHRTYDIERGGTGVYLHHSRVPLREADLSLPERVETVRQCGLGMCFV